MKTTFLSVLLLAMVWGTNAAPGTVLVRSKRIVNGKSVPKGWARWQVSIQRFGMHMCGGSLIRDGTWVMTAAHCTRNMKPNMLKVMVNVNNLKTDDNYTTMNVDEIFPHPGYKRSTEIHDIALFKISSREKSLLQEVNTISYIDTGEDRGASENLYYVTGFGFQKYQGTVSNQMMMTQVPLMPLEKCRKAFNKKYKIHSGNICLGGGKSDACSGDSGGPAVLCSRASLTPEACRLVGVTSWGVRCATPRVPGVYTRVSEYVAWVNATVKGYEGRHGLN